MAGGNLSPRQKMINMMYLVLTALLALNVSAEILEAFQSLRESLAESVEASVHKNSSETELINEKVQDEVDQGNKKNVGLIDDLKEINGKAGEVMTFLAEATSALEEIGEVDPATGHIVNMKELEGNYRYWMFPPEGSGKQGNDLSNGGRGAGKAMELKDNLDGYVDWANDFLKRADSTGQMYEEYKFDYLTHEAKEVEGAGNETWEYHTFHSKPLIADLAMIEKWKLDVTNIQYDLIGVVKSRLNNIKFKIDSLVAIDAPVSQVVAAGMKFETKLFVAMSSSEIKPEFSGTGSINVSPDGNSATMSMMARGGFAKGQKEKKQSYSARIKVPKADGTYEELTVSNDFIVRKPEVVITSASVQNLYWQCGNTINVDVPALGDLYNPVLKASSAQVLPSKSDKRKVTIVPTGKTCILSVSSKTSGQLIKIDDVKYKVIKPPKPDILLLVNGKEYNGASPISKKSNAMVKLKPDSDFKAALPQDARYVVSNVSLLAQKSLGAPTKVGSYRGGGGTVKCPLGNKLKNDPPGTKIYFKIDKIYRKNFRGKKVEEKFGDRDLYIGAVIR